MAPGADECRSAELDTSGHRPIRDRQHKNHRRSRPPLGVSRQVSDVDLLRDLDGVINFDDEVANGAFVLRVSVVGIVPAILSPLPDVIVN